MPKRTSLDNILPPSYNLLYPYQNAVIPIYTLYYKGEYTLLNREIFGQWYCGYYYSTVGLNMVFVLLVILFLVFVVVYGTTLVLDICR